MGRSSQEEGGPCVATTQETRNPGVLGSQVLPSTPPKPSCPLPQNNAVARASCCSSAAEETWSSPSALTISPSVTSQGWEGLN